VAAQAEGIPTTFRGYPAVVRLEEAKRCFVLLPRRWVVERSCDRASRFRRLGRDYERLSDTLAGCHWLVSAVLMAGRILDAVLHSA
jgi:transposase